MKLAFPIFLLLVSHVIAQPPAVDRWRVENIEESLTYSPQVVPPPFGTRIVEVGVQHVADVGIPGGSVNAFMHIRVNNNYNCDCGPVSAMGHFQFDFISEIDSKIDLSVGGRYGSISMTSGGSEVVWEYPSTIDAEQPLTIPPGAYLFVGHMEGTGLDPGNWGQLRLNIAPVPEPSTFVLVIIALMLCFILHRRVLKGFKLQAGSEATGVSGDK
jgi:hypothetical protein